ncbi:hypothetical protein M9Y10_004632 [Tritrichomonas musculus]|uniref:UDP-D-xylose:beta-D-glucoside alpha-1,3-D-xylosyltransferase n=1 Tax=Tritrichomonas musculus TaxID=1915356 RepID=A0ABR2JJC7_9EUKA
MEHSTNKSLWYNIYILTCPCFSKTAKQRIQSLSNKYSRLSIIFLSINRKFANYHPFKSSCSSILRLFLPDLLPNVQKIIHLDVDTYIFKDLDEMFYLNMTNLHFRGILDNDYYKEMEKFGFSDDHYINSGVLLMNLDEMRKDHFIESAADFLKKNGTSIYLVDQLLINIVSFNKCSLLPLTFGFHNWYCTEKLYKKFFKKPHFFKYYSYEEVHRIIYNLTIVHFMKKPWNYGMRPPYNRDWALTALKTDFINEISSSCRWIKLFLFL